jgi:prepilin signal peptidase PulO-like enzyme (type II secretory pathway)
MILRYAYDSLQRQSYRQRGREAVFACTFLFGISKGIIGLMAGLTIGVRANLIIQIRKNKAEGFPLIPYLAVGFIAAYFI